MTRGKASFCVTKEEKEMALTVQTGFVMIKKEQKSLRMISYPFASSFF